MTGCLYEVLGLSKDASQEDIRKAYRQRALQLHPDKNPGDEDAKAKFQLLQKVYGVLGDENKRKLYDHTGSTDDDELSGAGFDGLASAFRAMYGIKMEDIDDFTARYQGSADERADLMRYYNQFKGHMEAVFDHLMCSDPEFDSHRLRDVLEDAIGSGEVQRYKPYTAWAKSVAARPRPPARKPSAGGAGPTNALIATIQSKRAAAADSFFDSLAAKYGGKEKSKGKDKGKGGKEAKVALQQAAAEPTESEFEAARKRLEDRQALKGSGATSKEQAGKGKAKAAASAATGAGKKGGRSRALPNDDDEEEDGDNGDEGAGGHHESNVKAGDEEEEEGTCSAKRPGKKARQSDVGNGSAAAADGSVTAAEQRKSAKKQKQKSGVQGNLREEEGEQEENAAGGDGVDKRPLEARLAAEQEAAANTVAPGERSAGAKGKVKDKKDQGGSSDAGGKREAEKENKGGATPATGEKSKGKGKDKRSLPGTAGDADAPSNGGHLAKKVKRAAA